MVAGPTRAMKGGRDYKCKGDVCVVCPVGNSSYSAMNAAGLSSEEHFYAEDRAQRYRGALLRRKITWRGLVGKPGHGEATKTAS